MNVARARLFTRVARARCFYGIPVLYDFARLRVTALIRTEAPEQAYRTFVLTPQPFNLLSTSGIHVVESCRERSISVGKPPQLTVSEVDDFQIGSRDNFDHPLACPW